MIPLADSEKPITGRVGSAIEVKVRSASRALYEYLRIFNVSVMLSIMTTSVLSVYPLVLSSALFLSVGLECMRLEQPVK